MIERCADETDQAAAVVEAELETIIARARANAALPGLKADGECHWCGEPVEAPRLFCDAGCSGEWDMARKRQSRR